MDSLRSIMLSIYSIFIKCVCHGENEMQFHIIILFQLLITMNALLLTALRYEHKLVMPTVCATHEPVPI